MDSVEEILQGKECAVAFTLNEEGEARLVVTGEEALVMYAFVQLVKDLAVQDEITFDEALAKIKYLHDTCELGEDEGLSHADQIRKSFQII